MIMSTPAEPAILGNDVLPVVSEPDTSTSSSASPIQHHQVPSPRTPASPSQDTELCQECRLLPASDSFMIQCDNCNGWYHGRCCMLTEWQAAEFEIFHCRKCVQTKGPSKRKKRENWHRHDCFETNADSKPTQCGTISFLKQLKAKKFPDAFEVVTCLPDGQTINREYFETNGFSRPYVIQNTYGLNMRVPIAADFTVQNAVELLGENCRIDIIDSERQLVFESNLGRLRDYFNAPKREKIYNVISLEFTGTPMEEYVNPPHLVRELSWLPSIWPASGGEKINNVECPRTERFLLLSAAGCYTDFHIDFGGSSVWYHIVRGSKVFYVAPPTDENLKAYERWNDARNRVEKFLGDELKPCYKLMLQQGQTLLLPGGWIHSVITPSDSLVFGGNFLHSLDISLQLRIFDLEHRIHTDTKFLFPEFYSVNFFAARQLAEQLRDMYEDLSQAEKKSANEETEMAKNELFQNRRCSPQHFALLFTGCQALYTTLKKWIADDKCMKKCVLSTSECQSIACDLNKSIRLAESSKHVSKLCSPLKSPSSSSLQYQTSSPLKTSLSFSASTSSPSKKAKTSKSSKKAILNSPSSSSSGSSSHSSS